MNVKEKLRESHCSPKHDWSCEEPRLQYADGGRYFNIKFARSPGMAWNQEQFYKFDRAKRGACQGFSFGSRRRMLDRLNQISSGAELPVFVTCTLPDDSFNDSVTEFAKIAKAHLDNLPGTVADRLQGESAPTLTCDSSVLQEPGSLSFSWPSPYEYCLEGWYKPTTSDNISYLSGYTTGGYADSLAKVEQWTATSTSGKTLPGLTAGHYTMHVRTSTGKYEANLTFLVKKSSSSSKPPKK